MLFCTQLRAEEQSKLDARVAQVTEWLMHFRRVRRKNHRSRTSSERSVGDLACAICMICFRLSYFCKLWLVSALVFSQWSLCARICKLATPLCVNLW
jgi:hypothetical protein